MILQQTNIHNEENIVVKKSYKCYWKDMDIICIA